jgi:hypothetical protein
LGDTTLFASIAGASNESSSGHSNDLSGACCEAVATIAVRRAFHTKESGLTLCTETCTGLQSHIVGRSCGQRQSTLSTLSRLIDHTKVIVSLAIAGRDCGGNEGTCNQLGSINSRVVCDRVDDVLEVAVAGDVRNVHTGWVVRAKIRACTKAVCCLRVDSTATLTINSTFNLVSLTHCIVCGAIRRGAVDAGESG